MLTLLLLKYSSVFSVVNSFVISWDDFNEEKDS
jgi:hypothetical protein